MKSAIILSSILGVSISQAAVSLTFSAVTGAGNGVLTNLQSSTGVANTQRVWGVLVDSNDDGVKLDQYIFGAGLGLSSSTTLKINSGGLEQNTDDVLYVASALMVNTNNATLDGGTLASGNLARPTSFLNIPTPNGSSLGDNFYIVWFDETAATGSTVAGGKYGAFRLPTFELPADGASVSFASNFVGVDTARQASFTWQAVPEHQATMCWFLGRLAK